ncbi:MAG TPA: GNAT family N-acetyltransferase [Patescibacteria group bacterium]|nr:GNAT family N-acetyltransferase [Patescibacteria group bacterium]
MPVRGAEIGARVRAVERRDEWNEIVREFPDCDTRHAWEWGELRARQGWTPLRLAAFAGGECLAAAAVLARRVPGLGVVAYAPRGPLVDLKRNDTWDAAAALADAARARTGAFVVRTSPAVLVEDAVAWTPLEARGFRRLHDLWSFWNTPRNVMRLDLEGNEADLLARMAKKRRQHISTAAKKGASADVVRGLGALHTLRGLLLDRAGRERLLVPSAAYLEALHGLFGRKDGVATVLGRVNGEVAGAAVGVRFGGTAHLLYAVTTPAARSAPVGDLMHWEWMRWARAGGCRVLDLGSSCTDIPPSPTHPNYGIYRFKTELGARFCLYAGYYDRVYAPATYHVARWLEHRTLRNARRCATVVQSVLRGLLKVGAPKWPPHPQRSERPGEPVTVLDHPS